MFFCSYCNQKVFVTEVLLKEMSIFKLVFFSFSISCFVDDVLNETIKRTLNVSKSFMENYNEFLTNQIDIKFDIEIVD